MRTNPKKELLAAFNWAEAALHCPELLSEAWQDLAASYRRGGIFPFVLQINVYTDGTITATHGGYIPAKKRMTATVDCIERILNSPFGKGSEAAIAAKEYVEKKNQEVAAYLKKEAEDRAELNELLGGSFGRK